MTIKDMANCHLMLLFGGVYSYTLGNVADITLPLWSGVQLSVGEFMWGNPAGTPS